MAKRPRHPQPSAPRERRRWTLSRLWAIALVTFRQGLRTRLWVLVPPAILVMILADLSSPRFDPVFEAVPATISMSLLVMAVLAFIVGTFFATYSLPAELESKVAQSVVTKPVGRAEIVGGKTLGMSLVVLLVVGCVGVAGYAYTLVRASSIQSLAGERLVEATPRAAYPADLNALQAVATNGPLETYRYYAATSGPEIDLDAGPEAAASPNVRWILGETGMRLVWSMANTPLQEWVASAPGRLRLRLSVKAPLEKPKAPVQVLVGLLPADIEPVRENPRPGGQGPVYQMTMNVPPSGELEIAVVGPDIRPPAGAINVPPGDNLVLYVVAIQSGALVGAGPGALTIVGPAGQEYAMAEAPAVASARQRQRLALAGRAKTPRELAVFRFDNVPGDVLGQGDTPVEAGFSLDAWSPVTVQAAAQVIFIRSDGRTKTVRFSPESHHSAILYLDREFWHGGPLVVQVECLTDDDFLWLVPDSVRLHLGGGPFAWNYAKAVLRVWLFGTVLSAIGVCCSTFLSWFVSILLTMVVVLVSMVRGFVLEATPLGGLARQLYDAANGWYPWAGWRSVVEHVAVPLPDLRSLIPAESVSMGQVMTWTDLGEAFGWAALSVAVFVLVGAWILRHREVAR